LVPRQHTPRRPFDRIRPGTGKDIWQIRSSALESSWFNIPASIAVTVAREWAGGAELRGISTHAAATREGSTMATAQELLKEGKPAEALTALQAEVRAAPNDAKKRVFLFQLLTVLGQWERAATQLKVANDLDATTLLMAQVCGPALAAENLRAEIFAGKRTPLLLGEPEEWVGWMLQANKHFAEGQVDAARELRERAFEAAPATSGTIRSKDGESAFEWIADADQRFGPILEAIIDGKYYWVPFNRIKEITIEGPTDLRDLVWLPAIFTLTTGTQKIALLPVRYPGTEHVNNGAAQLARVTDWVEKGDITVGLGQRIVATDATELPLLEVRKIILNTVVQTGTMAEVAAAGGIGADGKSMGGAGGGGGGGDGVEG
jgi:type VI secretion system protein ImpE